MMPIPDWALQGDLPDAAAFEDLVGAARHCLARGLEERAWRLTALALRVDGSVRPEPLVVLGSVPWSFLHQRPQQLALEFGRQGRLTIYVEPEASTAVVSHYDPGKLRPVFLGAFLHSVRRVGPNCYAVPLIRYVEDSGGYRHEDAPHVFFEVLKEVLGTREPWALAYLPQQVEAIGLMGSLGLLSYDCVDEFSGFSHAGRNIEVLEKELLERSDVVFVTAERLRQSKSRWNSRTYLVPNGVNSAHFAGLHPRPKELEGQQSPVVTFVGALADWVDLELIRALALRRPEWHFLLIGPAFTPTGAIQGLTNVQWLGRREYDQLPAYLAHSDVGLIPFKINELTLNSDPIKGYEYLAAGLPVVSTDLPQVRRLRAPGVVEIAATPDDFEAAILGLINQGDDEQEKRKRMRLAVAAQQSWAERAAAMLAVMEGHYGLLQAKWEAAAAIFAATSKGAADLDGLHVDTAIARSLSGMPEGDVAETVHALGLDWVKRGRLESALRLFSEWTRLMPGDADAWFNLASVQVRLEQWNEALASAGRRVTLIGPDGDALALLGTALLGAGYPVSARRMMEQSLKLLPEREDIRESLVMLDALNAGGRQPRLPAEVHQLLQRVAAPFETTEDESSGELVPDEPHGSTAEGVWDTVFAGVNAGSVEVPSSLARELADVFLRHVEPAGSLLEAGSGSGALSAHLSQRGYRTTLLDQSPVALTLSRQVYQRFGLAGEFVGGDLFRLPFPDGQFDCVWNSGVMEHFSDDRIVEGLKEMARVSRNKVIVLVPNAACLFYRVGKWALERNKTWPYGDEYARYSSADLFERAGLRVVEEAHLATDTGIDWIRYLGSVGGDVVRLLQSWQGSLGPEDQALRRALSYLLVTVGEKR